MQLRLYKRFNQFPLTDEIYLGLKNPIKLFRKISAPFSCTMNLRNFPFDSQTCVLKIRLSTASEENVIFKNVAAFYEGEVIYFSYIFIIDNWNFIIK